MISSCGLDLHWWRKGFIGAIVDVMENVPHGTIPAFVPEQKRGDYLTGYYAYLDGDKYTSETFDKILSADHPWRDDFWDQREEA